MSYKNTPLTTSIAAASILASALSPLSASAHADKPGFEKCRGIAKAGMNDCGANGHACAGFAKVDGDANEWIFVPEGTCQKIVGGKLVPAKKPAATAPASIKAK